MSDQMEIFTELHEQYTAGKNYIDRLKIVQETDEAYRFYEGDQWRGLKDAGERMPILDQIRPIVDYKVAIITQNIMEIVYSNMIYDDPQFIQIARGIAEKLNRFAMKEWENKGMDYVCYNMVRDAAICRAKYIYFYLDRGREVVIGGKKTYPDMKIDFDLIDSANVMFADEQERDYQKQPYILFPVRRRVADVKAEAKANGIPKEQIDLIRADDNKDLQTGDRGKIEVDHKDGINGTDQGKCMTYLRIKKINGTVHVCKATESVTYCPEKDTGLKDYPFTGMVWMDVKGTCRGQGEVNRLVPNQMMINKIMAYRYINMKMTAFAKLVYDGDAVKNPEEIVEVGTAIKVNGKGMTKALDSVGYLQPSQFNSEPANILEYLSTVTKENAGASDVALGNSKADNYRAILAIQEANAAPLTQQQVRYKKMIEDIARIWFDMWSNYYTSGLPITVETEMQDENGQKFKAEVQEIIPYKILQKIKLQVKVDVTPNSPYNKLVEQQRVDNLLANGQIQLDEILPLLAETDPLKIGLEELIENRGEMQQLQDVMAKLIEENTNMKEALEGAGLMLAQKDAEKADVQAETYKQAQIDAIKKLAMGGK